MDIVIRNGKIQEDESKRIHNIKNEHGLLKKDYQNYNNNTPGPYYDLFHIHIHVWRQAHKIRNFMGPQNPLSIKLTDIPYKPTDVYCSICHLRKRFVNTGKIQSENVKLIKQELISWYKFYDRLHNNNKPVNIVHILKNQKKTNILRWYRLMYKFLYKPCMYPISKKETKLIWPWDLTPYQKFKLNHSEYKTRIIHDFESKDIENGGIFLKDRDILTNYVMIC